ncbi:uncharacterized protein DEA37_0006488 [Paragonimus westermani]|uniref:Uncharacterized protein n=1 Tax=Paragonimus westermani TaxID=34504 RepID=A0A5J4NMG0_9TREM|nr:uncharacterized protein DEA37_0006488 [Paragonimus westermani]
MLDRFTYPNGDYYEGEYIQSQNGILKQGHGTYIGLFTGSLAAGNQSENCSTDSCTLKPSQKLVDEECNGTPFYLSSSKCREIIARSKLGIYSGMWNSDRIEGFGTAIFPNGAVYEGEFIDGKMHGEGIYWWSSGYVLKGFFVKNRLVIGSSVTLTDPQGNEWNGVWNGDNEVTGKRKNKEKAAKTRLFFKLKGF